MSGVNSINWARIIAQAVYYFYSYLKLDKETISFSVPTGNFGDVFAGYLAKKMGLPIDKLIIATNENDVLSTFTNKGFIKLKYVKQTITPSMDIQLPSNLERFIYDLFNKNNSLVINKLKKLYKNKKISVSKDKVRKIQKYFKSSKVSEVNTISAIKNFFYENKIIIDPHTAVGVCAEKNEKHNNTVNVYISTAHPAKFPGTVYKALKKKVDIASQIMGEEFDLAGVATAGSGIGLHNDICVPYFKEYCNEEQKQRWMPGITKGSLITAIAMSEPGTGSDLASIATTAIKDGESYVLNGAKTFISNGINSDLVIVAAKTQPDSKHRGISLLIVERGMEGFTTPETHNKWSLRASATGELVFDNVKIPKENILPNKDGLGAPLGCLDSARYGIAWGAIGAAMDCYDTALRYSKERIQFGKPIAAFQLQQKKLAEMITEITKAQFITLRLGQLKNEDKATSAQISMCKRNNVEMALNITREARQILGGMGITGEYSIMRHMMNLESVITYEGTHDIHLLITGLDITGENAFK